MLDASSIYVQHLALLVTDGDFEMFDASSIFISASKGNDIKSILKR